MRKFSRITSNPISQLTTIPQGFYYYPISVQGGANLTIPINITGTQIYVPTASNGYTADFTGVNLSVNFAMTITIMMTYGGSASI